jgi:hypothetical protein
MEIRINRVSLRTYSQKSFGELHPWLKLKYQPGCQVRAMDMPEAQAYELYQLLGDYFSDKKM